jgi:hypothetical protein
MRLLSDDIQYNDILRRISDHISNNDKLKQPVVSDDIHVDVSRSISCKDVMPTDQ